jgi:S1-C subfamily serine protease
VGPFSSLSYRGKVIGVKTMMISRGETYTGPSFAVSVETARQIVPELIGQ